MQNLQNLFVEQLRDIYSAETQLVDALPKMANAATSNRLKQAFNHHLDQTKNHVQRLERIFDNLNTSPKGETCEAMQGLIKEGEQIMNKDGDKAVKDAALIAAAQRIEHYEIAAYGTVCAYAEELSESSAHGLLEQTLREEKQTDSKLTNLAVNVINPNAEHDEFAFADETVIALYRSFDDARGAVEGLIDAGFSPNYLSLIANDQDERYSTYVREMDLEKHDSDAGDGAGFGAVVGTLTGLGVALIPGLGGFVVAGAAGAALFAGIGAAAGAATGGLTAGLMDMGVDRDRAERYTEELRRGGSLVIAHVNDKWEDQAESIMRRHNPVDIKDVDRKK